MRREAVLLIGIAVLAVGSSIAVVAIPGAVAERDPGDTRPGHLEIREVTIAPGEVTGGTATLEVTTHLDNRGGRSDNLSIEVRAVDVESGMTATTRSTPVDAIDGDRSVQAPVNVTVAREGGYRIESVLYRDERRVGTAAVTVRGVGTLQSGGRVEFHRFGDGGGEADLPSIQYSIEDSGTDRTTLDVSAYLTNRGATPSGDVSLEFVVRQADSNIVAARETIDVGAIAPGETVSPGTTVTVPAEYNYYLDAVLREGAVVVDDARSVANLDPQERISANETVRDVGLRVEDFERPERTVRVTPDPDREASTGGQPGFGVPGALAALAAVGIIAWRRRQ